MPLGLFDKAMRECKDYTKLVALHILGDPLRIQNIKEYLSIAKKYGLSVEITTSGIYLGEFDFLLQAPIRQVNFSLDALFELPSSELRDKSLDKIFQFCRARWNGESEIFINLRIQKRQRNLKFIEMLKQKFNLTHISLDSSTRIGTKTLIVIREPFHWLESMVESMAESSQNTSSYHLSEAPIPGFCVALKEHFGILSNGDVVPCCMDSSGYIVLGNLYRDSITHILQSPRTQNMIQGFKNGLIMESFCKICDYRKRFD